MIGWHHRLNGHEFDQIPGDYEGVITHLEPDILECEVKWALGSITMNKASGGDGISVELFQIFLYIIVTYFHFSKSLCSVQLLSRFGLFATP